MARNLSRNLAEMTVDDIMTRSPKTVKKSVLATSALATLEKFHIGALIVIDDDNRPIGLVHFHDLLRIGVA
ncbi:Arabinose 5-phosphate isomerase KdsD [compost metagenome]